VIEGVAEIRDAYRDDGVASTYIDQRFRQPLGALLHQRQAAVLRHVIADCRPDSVLEIAPGPARLTIEIVSSLRKPPVVIDASPQMLAQAKHRLAEHGASAAMIEGDAFRLPFRSAFDLVYTFRLIRHFDEEDRIRLYRQIASTLRPGGLLVFDAVNDIVSRRVRARAAAHEYQHYDALVTPDGLAKELSQGGFAIRALVGVQHRYPLLQKVQTLIAPRSPSVARGMLEVIDRSGGEPLEWVVVCHRA
jgi:ubiquinone/menaquinone biosynthesis C-methylase UbiE